MDCLGLRQPPGPGLERWTVANTAPSAASQSRAVRRLSTPAGKQVLLHVDVDLPRPQFPKQSRMLTFVGGKWSLVTVRLHFLFSLQISRKLFYEHRHKRTTFKFARERLALAAHQSVSCLLFLSSEISLKRTFPHRWTPGGGKLHPPCCSRARSWCCAAVT